MPESISSIHEKSTKNEVISPKKKDYSDILQTEQIASKAQNLLKNPPQLYQGVSSSSSFSTNSFKGLNFSMGSDFKEKFNSMHGEQIKALNIEQSNY
jgi:hypothetical protein